MTYISSLIDYILSYELKEDRSGINSILYLDAERALRRERKLSLSMKRGRLHGIPILIKDNINTRHIVTTCATETLRGNVPSSNADIVQILLNEGAIILGKTNLSELMLSAMPNNESFAGICRNPYNLEHTTGGSSGGSAAAVACKFSPISLGTETIGSIRGPASYCGVYGFRPTTGRYSRSGIIPLSRTLDTPGFLVESPQLLPLLDSIITGDDRVYKFSKIRLGVPREFFHDKLSEDVRNAFYQHITRLNVELLFIDLPFSLESIVEMCVTIISFEARDDLGRSIDEINGDINNPMFGMTVDKLLDGVETKFNKGKTELIKGRVDQKKISEAYDAREKMRKMFEIYMNTNNLDSIIVPNLDRTAPRLDDDEEEVFGSFVRILSFASFIGLPAVSMPIGLDSKGLPIGCDLIGLDDRKVLSLVNHFSHLYTPL